MGLIDLTEYDMNSIFPHFKWHPSSRNQRFNIDRWKLIIQLDLCIDFTYKSFGMQKNYGLSTSMSLIQ